jgi:transcriptional antiterminator NusG
MVIEVSEESERTEEAREEVGEVKARPAKKTTRFYALTVTGGTEERVALVLYERAKRLGLDVRSIIVPPNLKGYVIVEIGNEADLYYLTRGVRHIKRRRPILMKPEEIELLVKPRAEIPELRKGDIVEITGGPFKGMKGRVIEVYPTRGEVDLTLLESNFQMVVTVPLDQVRPVTEESG